jgi:hypothetical protein
MPLHSRLARHLAIVEILSLPVFVDWYIWRLQFTSPTTWIVFPIWLTGSFLLQKDTPKTLGWRADNIVPATKQAAVAYGLMTAGLFVIGLFLRSPLSLPPNLASPHRLWSYFGFCVLQQVALNSLLNNRVMLVVTPPWISSLLTGCIFAVCHWPNPVLVPLTFIGGSVMAWLFARERNIIPLAIGQAILGSIAWWSFPLAWHHHLRVGPGYYLG